MQNRHIQVILFLNDTRMKVSSDFDSGNMENAQIVGKKLIITPALDPMNSQYSSKQSSKTFFHFAIHSNKTISIPLVIERMKILQYFVNEEQFKQYYRVCVARRKKGERTYLQRQYVKSQFDSIKITEKENQYQLSFILNVEADQEVFIAYHYPYSYQKCQHFLTTISQQIVASNSTQINSKPIYYRNQTLIESLEGRSINLITISQNSKISKETESRVSKSLFPFFELEERPKKILKPYIVFTCRVHSGQSSSSYALEGIINFLISNDERAVALRSLFAFLFIPMINPDGVFHGTYRMDTMGHNLNRFYNNAQPNKQPSIFAIQTLLSSYSDRVIFFMDLHSHPHPNKGSFIYGNSFQVFEDQVESQIYAKILSKISECFSYNSSSFSQAQMTSKDTNEVLSKEGSARVQMYKQLGCIFSYTMELGYHGCLPKNIESHLPKNIEKENHFISNYQREHKIFTIQDYHSHGKCILLSILQLFLFQNFEKKSTSKKLLQPFREEISKEILEKQERFRLSDLQIFKKAKNINQLIRVRIYDQIFKRFSFLEVNISTIYKKTKIMKDFEVEELKEAQNIEERKLKKRQISFSLECNSKTLDIDVQNRNQLNSYRSLEASEAKDQHKKLYERQVERDVYYKEIKFAKYVNLNFNPFPRSERKKIYSLVGNNRIKAKPSRQLQLQRLFPEIHTNTDFIDTIDVMSQLQLAQLDYNKIKKPNTPGHLQVMQNFKSIDLSVEDKDLFDDEKYEKIENQEEESHALGQQYFPKIANKNSINSSRFQNKFDEELRIRKQYSEKYQIQENKEYPVHYRSALRQNHLKMKSLFSKDK